MRLRYFGTDGIRGTAGEHPVDAAGAARLGRAVAQVLGGPARTVCLGRDSRPSGEELSEAMADGLRAGGCDVLDLGLVPTPAVAHFVDQHGAAAGIAVSASHNPADQNGFKVFGPGGEKLPWPLEHRIETAFDATLKDAPARGTLTRVAYAAAQYVEFALRTVPESMRLDGLRIAVDCAHGATCATTPLALARLGAKVVPVCCEPDGAKINDHCGSLHPELVQHHAARAGAELGLAHDGDGDRLVLIDECGELVCGDRILGLSAAGLQSRGELSRDCVVGTILTNYGLERWLDGRGVRLSRSEVGDRNVWQMMRQEGADLGGEPSGHTILRRLARTDDALLTALHVLALRQSSGLTLHELAADIPMVPQVTANLRVHAKPAMETIPGLPLALAEARRQLAGEGRVIVRYSGTEPVARILVEGPSAPVLQQVVGLLTSAFASISA